MEEWEWHQGCWERGRERKQGVGKEPIYFMTEASMARAIVVLAGIWKNMGWGTVVYLVHIGHFLDFGFERIWIFQNTSNVSSLEIFDAYIIRQDCRQGGRKSLKRQRKPIRKEKPLTESKECLMIKEKVFQADSAVRLSSKSVCGRIPRRY